MPRPLARILPALAVLALLALALLGPARNVRAGRNDPAEVEYLYYPQCTNVFQGGVGDGTPYDILGGEGITQPLGSPQNFASTIVPQTTGGYADLRYRLVYWDPVNLVPSAGQLQLRSRSYTATYYAIDYSRQDLFPPVITRALTSVAEPPPAQVALEETMSIGITGVRTLTLVADDPGTAPPALRIHPDGSRTVLPGAHPAFSYQLCGGDALLQSLRVVQSVMKPDQMLDPDVSEYIQKFNIPVDATVRWIELAFGAQPPYGELSWGRVQIFDASGQSSPPFAFGTPLLDAQISVAAWYTPGGQWDTHLDLTSFPTLTAHHDYWLVVNPVRDYWFYSKTLQGNEGWNFVGSIGGLWRRDIDYAPAAAIAGRALDFRIIGTPTGTVGVAPLPPRSPLALHVTPNPARGATAIVWAGAEGDVRLEAFDARSRRVATTTQRGDNGRWALGAGGALPAGVYFVRARDGAGHTASVRVTLVR